MGQELDRPLKYLSFIRRVVYQQNEGLRVKIWLSPFVVCRKKPACRHDKQEIANVNRKVRILRQFRRMRSFAPQNDRGSN